MGSILKTKFKKLVFLLVFLLALFQTIPVLAENVTTNFAGKLVAEMKKCIAPYSVVI